MMKYLHMLVFSLMFSGLLFVAAQDVQAQDEPQEVTIRDLNTYPFTLTSLNDLSDHPLAGVPVTFDAVVVSNPRSSGLASITDAGLPGRLHVYIEDVMATEMGRDGMGMQIVENDDAIIQEFENLNRGDVVTLVGSLTFFNNVAQFDPTDVTFIGNVNSDEEFADAAALLEPRTVALSEINEAAGDGRFRWNSENYEKYANSYVKIEGVEIINRAEAETGRPRIIGAADGVVAQNYDTSLRFRNDKNNYAYDPETGEGRGYNYRRPDVDGPYVPPAAGSVVDWSGFVVVNTFDPDGIDVDGQNTLRLNYFEDGFVWINDGDDPADRVAPEGWPNDLQVVGFAPIIDQLQVTPEGDVFAGDDVSVSLDALLPEDDYTLESVEITYSSYAYTEDEGSETTEAMTAEGGDTYSFNFGSFDEFTRLDFTISVTVNTPEGVETSATQSETVFVRSDEQTYPVVFSPAGGIYNNFVEVSLSSPDEEADIYFTLDGSEPDTGSELYSDPFSIDETTEVRAVAVLDGNSSPVNSRTYEIQADFVDVSTLAELRNSPADGTLYRYTGEAVVTYTRDTRNQKYIQDETGGMLIDDASGIITDFYPVGGVMTGLVGTLGSFQGVTQYVPELNPGAPIDEVEIEPVFAELADIDLDIHESMLVEVSAVEFLIDDTDAVFEAGTNYDIVDPSVTAEDPITLRTNFGNANYIGLPIPSGAITLKALVGNFNGNLQLIPRFATDLEIGTSTEPGENPQEFNLSQNYPNPFNPTTNISYNLPEAADVRLNVYDILGRRVASLVSEQQVAGEYTINFDASRLASGTYVYRLEAGNFMQTRKMMLIK
jgi:hypothetical protein